ncbi:MAG: DinB family protein [Dehalococcoidia bacterium]
MTKSDLLEALRTTGKDLVARVASIDPARLEEGRYENGWNARLILAHVASIEWTYKRLVENAVSGVSNAYAAAATPSSQGQPAQGAIPAGARPRAAVPQAADNPIDDYNARQVEKRKDATVAELLDEFRQNRAGTIAAVESATDELLTKPTRSAGGAQGTLADVIDFVAVQHVRVHTRDILGGKA